MSGMINLIMMVVFCVFFKCVFNFFNFIGEWNSDRMNGRGLYVSPDGA